MLNKIIILLAGVYLTTGMLPPGSLASVPGTGKILQQGADETLTLVLKFSGRGATVAERKLLQKQLGQKIMNQGKTTLDKARNGSLAIAKAPAKYRSELRHWADRVPGGAKALAQNPEKYLPLCRKHGDAILLIEKKAAGMAPAAAKTFSQKELDWIAQKVPGKDIPLLISFGARANNPLVRQQLINGYQKTGGQILRNLDSRRIMALGLSAAMVTGAYQTSNGIQQSLMDAGDAILIVAREHPEQLGDTLNKVTEPVTKPVSKTFTMAITIVAGVLTFTLLYCFWPLISATRRKLKKLVPQEKTKW